MAYENVARPTGIYKFINCEHNGLTTGILYSEQNWYVCSFVSVAELRGKGDCFSYLNLLACTVEIVDSFTSKMAEAVPAVAVQAEVRSFHSELAFTLFTV